MPIVLGCWTVFIALAVLVVRVVRILRVMPITMPSTSAVIPTNNTVCTQDHCVIEPSARYMGPTAVHNPIHAAARVTNVHRAIEPSLCAPAGIGIAACVAMPAAVSEVVSA